MDIQPTEQKSQAISDDQELAKVLAGVNNNSDDGPSLATPPMTAPSTPMPDAAAPNDDSSSAPAAEPADDSAELPPMPEMPDPSTAPPASANSDLDIIKQEALGELRPLVDKLNVGPEEKFDTYLLLLRSTDDRDLIAPAHEAAKNITDEARKAQALLDIIKEIDFLNQGPAQAN